MFMFMTVFWLQLHLAVHLVNYSDDFSVTRRNRRLYWTSKGQFDSGNIVSAIFLFISDVPVHDNYFNVLNCLLRQFLSNAVLAFDKLPTYDVLAFSMFTMQSNGKVIKQFFHSFNAIFGKVRW